MKMKIIACLAFLLNTVLFGSFYSVSKRWMRVVADYKIRGNIKTLIFVEHAQAGYVGPQPEYRRRVPVL